MIYYIPFDHFEVPVEFVKRFPLLSIIVIKFVSFRAFCATCAHPILSLRLTSFIPSSRETQRFRSFDFQFHFFRSFICASLNRARRRERTKKKTWRTRAWNFDERTKRLNENDEFDDCATPLAFDVHFDWSMNLNCSIYAA